MVRGSPFCRLLLYVAPMPDLTPALNLIVAALVGLAVGVEREWSGHTTGPDARLGGARTFTLLGAIGGFSGWMLQVDQLTAGALFIGAALAFVVVSYATAMMRPGTSNDSTTEVAALLVVALGVTAGLGHQVIASAAATIGVLLLAEKSRLQVALGRIAPNEMRAALHFAVLALVILPLIPNRSFGPYDAFQPRLLWIVVLVFSALNFIGYIARRAVGDTRGLAITGLLGGLVSSTAVTLAFSRKSRVPLARVEEERLALPLALGVVGACTVLVPRVLIISALLQPAVGVAATYILGPAFVAGIGLVAFLVLREQRTRPHAPNSSNGAVLAPGESPLGLRSSLQMAVGFQLVLFAIAWVQSKAGETGVLASATLLGLTNVDALTFSMARYGSDAEHVKVAAAAMGIGILSNTVLKLVIAVTLGSPRFRILVSGGLLLLASAIALGIFIGWP